ncbi:MAG: hypothetical protein PHO92_01080 [Candidatus Peribacteraceae bacterium]|nr:hypothetical protein [Candidatus Peribacteraceae bacterium]
METCTKRRYLSLTLLSGLVLVTAGSSLASYAILGSVRSYETEPFAAQARVKQQALDQRSAILQQRLGFRRALEDCITRRMTDKTVVCPDINDIDSYRKFIRTDADVSQSLHRAAPSLESKLSELTARERALVEQYAQRGSCSATLAGRGLYTLCLELLEAQGGSASAVRGFLNDRAARGLQRAAAQPSALRDRIRQAQESLGQLFQRDAGQPHYQAR